MTEPRKALVCARELGEDGCFLHVLLDDDEQLLRIAVSAEIATGVQLNVTVDVPPGDLTNPSVSAGIAWRF